MVKRFRGITTKVIMLLMAAAVLPLLLFAVISVRSLRVSTEESVTDGHLNVATRAAEQISAYVSNSIAVLRAMGAELNGTRLAPWQQDRVAKNFVLAFPEFREISYFTPNGSIQATSRIGAPRLAPPPPGSPRQVLVSPITIDDDLLPTTRISVPIAATADTPGGWIVGELSLEELWRMVDRIRVGEHGYAALFSSDGRLVAHGDPNEKRHVARGELIPEHDLAAALRAGGPPSRSYTDEDGVAKLGTGALVKPFDWAVIVEQPHAEAFAIARRVERQLVIAIIAALFMTLAIGAVWARSNIPRILALRRATEALAAGRLDERVSIKGNDEIRQLGDAFNTMADRLVQLQDSLRLQERQATFGRVAAGLVHDLSHPVQIIEGSFGVLWQSWDDLEFREVFRGNVEREVRTVMNILEDLRSIARPIALDRSPVDANTHLRVIVQSMAPLAAGAGVDLRVDVAEDPAVVNGNEYAMGRVYRNLIQNALQATAPGGSVTVSTERAANTMRIRVADTGVGIAPDRLHTIFEDYVTTKKRGLGLGLAISRRLVEQLDGTISVTSEVGKGTVFTIELPLQTVAV